MSEAPKRCVVCLLQHIVRVCLVGEYSAPTHWACADCGAAWPIGLIEPPLKKGQEK